MSYGAPQGKFAKRLGIELDAYSAGPQCGAPWQLDDDGRCCCTRCEAARRRATREEAAAERWEDKRLERG